MTEWITWIAALSSVTVTPSVTRVYLHVSGYQGVRGGGNWTQFQYFILFMEQHTDPTDPQRHFPEILNKMYRLSCEF